MKSMIANILFLIIIVIAAIPFTIIFGVPLLTLALVDFVKENKTIGD